ncbi:MAG: Mce protein [Mycobacterium sp.]
MSTEVEDTEVEVTEVTEVTEATEATEDTETVPPVDDTASADSAGGPSGVRKWLSHNRRTATIAAAASFVVAAGFAGAAVEPYLMNQAVVATKLRIARTAADAITTLWSYTPEDMDRLPDRSAKYLAGDFEEQYRKYVDAIAPTNKQAKVTSSTKVVGAAVESLRGSDATAIVYTNTTSTSPQNNNIPAMKYLSYRLELQRHGRDWRVTKMTTVTSLDLSPKLGL